jgi:hypothetical protein
MQSLSLKLVVLYPKNMHQFMGLEEFKKKRKYGSIFKMLKEILSEFDFF